MCCNFKIIGLILLLMGIGILLGIIIPCNAFILAVIFIGVGLAIILN